MTASDVDVGSVGDDEASLPARGALIFHSLINLITDARDASEVASGFRLERL
jgi:hypothetical protein